MKRSLLALLLTNTPWWISGADQADQIQSWRGLQIAPEERCSDYDRGDYPVPPALEDSRIDLTLEPGQHIARYLDEAPLFPDVLGPRTAFAGHAVIRSTEGGHFAVAGLLQNTTTGSVAVVTPGIK